MFVQKGLFLSICVNIECFYRFSKTPHGRETQLHAEKLSSFTRSSHLDPIGEQNDIQQLLIYCVIFAYLVLEGTHAKVHHGAWAAGKQWPQRFQAEEVPYEEDGAHRYGGGNFVCAERATGIAVAQHHGQHVQYSKYVQYASYEQ